MAIAEAALRPNLHYVAVKNAGHQARAVAFRTHQCFVGQRTQLINALRGHLTELGLIVVQGPASLRSGTDMRQDEATDLPNGAKDVARLYLEQIELLTTRINEVTLRLRGAGKVNDEMRRLCTVPSVGPVTARSILAFAPDLPASSNGRNFASYIISLEARAYWLRPICLPISIGSRLRSGRSRAIGEGLRA